MSGSAKMFQIAPTTFHGIRSGIDISTRHADAQAPRRGIARAIAMPERHLDHEDDRGEQQLAPSAP